MNNTLRVLQYNVLADGLSQDGFVCSSSLSTINGDIHSIPQFLKNIKTASKLYDTKDNQQTADKCLDWYERWVKIVNLIYSTRPDIIVFQEMDHYAEALIDLGCIGYSSTIREQYIEYMPLWKNNRADKDTYIPLLEEQQYAFIPKLFSKARKFSLMRGVNDPDNDGCAIFWRSDRFNLEQLHFCQFYKYQSDEKDSDGAMAVVLRDIMTNEQMSVITTHLPSGATTERELERLELLSNTEKGVFKKFILNLMKKVPRTIVALDANSDPLETYGLNNTNTWKAFKKMHKLYSIWGDYCKLKNAECRPVTVNKIRGPTSNQPSKIGVHSHELIDHIFYSGIFMHRFAIPPVSFVSKEHALENLIPNMLEPSDHYPVMVDFYL